MRKGKIRVSIMEREGSPVLMCHNRSSADSQSAPQCMVYFPEQLQCSDTGHGCYGLGSHHLGSKKSCDWTQATLSLHALVYTSIKCIEQHNLKGLVGELELKYT